MVLWDQLRQQFCESVCMTFHETKIPGVFETFLEPIPDERRYLAESWCRKGYWSHRLNRKLV